MLYKFSIKVIISTLLKRFGKDMATAIVKIVFLQ